MGATTCAHPPSKGTRTPRVAMSRVDPVVTFLAAIIAALIGAVGVVVGGGVNPAGTRDTVRKIARNGRR
jgi:hypothetical protein